MTSTSFFLVKFLRRLTLYQLLVSSSDQCMAAAREVDSGDWRSTTVDCKMAFVLYSSGGFKFYLQEVGGPAASYH